MQTSIVSIVFLSIFLGFIPVVFYSWFFFLRRRKKFQKGKQATALLTMMFFGGIGAVVLSFFTERWLIGFLPPEFGYCVAASPLCQTGDIGTILILALATFLIVGPVEEGYKWLAAYLLSFRSPKFTRIIDGVKYGVAVGLGFAAAENALYLFTSLRELDLNTFVSTFLLRFAISTLAHVLYSGIFGYFIGKAHFQRYNKGRTLLAGFTLAVLTHGLFDFVLFSQVGFYAIILLAIMLGAVLLKLRAPENYAVRIPEYIRKKPKLREEVYSVPVETDLSAAYSGIAETYSSLPKELQPVVPRKIKEEFLPKEVPSEFATDTPQEKIKEDLKVPEETVPTRSGTSADMRSEALSASGAQRIVRSSVERAKKRTLQMTGQGQ